MKVVVVGAGWAGCAAALAARKQGAEVTLVERTDMLLGTGLVGGIMRNNGRFTAAEEMLAMGGGELFELTDSNSLHRDIEFPGHPHASLYNVATMEPIVRAFLESRGVEIRPATRINDAELKDGAITAIHGQEGDETVSFTAGAYIDSTGTAGPPGQCAKHGNGCVLCILRCPAFGGRVSVTALCGVREIAGRKGSRVGAMSGSCKLLKESLSRDLVSELNRRGVVVVPLPPSLQKDVQSSIKACQQYAIPEFQANLVLLDTGHAKLMVPFFPLAALRKIGGFENARYEDPYAGGLGNSVRYVAMSPRDDGLKVQGVANLFCAGERAGLLVGHTEAIVTGTLAGFNAVRHIRGEPPLNLPRSLAAGDAIGFVREQMTTEEGLGCKFTFSGSVYFERMKEKGTYTTDRKTVRERVEAAGLLGIFQGGP
ncbi:MAG TPA: FAD-dependent oxidoreductase [Syntrophales bacterium]|nr:FAD-dependent oxidoreductase [Syntrophales bacterium]